MVCRQAGIERRGLLSYDPAAGAAALAALARALQEAAMAHYAAAAQRRLSVHGQRGSASPDLALRTAFKVCGRGGARGMHGWMQG